MFRRTITVISAIAIGVLTCVAVRASSSPATAPLRDTAKPRSVTSASTAATRSSTAATAAVEQSAIASTTSVAVTHAVAASTTTSPVYLEDFPDPFVLETDDGYLAFSTNSRGFNVPVLRSSDLVHWYSSGDAAPRLPSWAAQSGTWAPSVIETSGTYVMYLTVHDTRRDRECIVTATSTTAAGPYAVTSDQPFTCAASGSIDASALRDNDGQLWLTWKNEPHGSHPAEIISARLRADGLALVGTQSTLVGATEQWENGNIEGPSLAQTANGYILFFSSGSWRSSNYNTGYATCTTPAGPCTVREGALLSQADGLEGPGGLQVFRSSSGTTYAAFHTWRPCSDCTDARRVLNIRRIDLDTAVPTLE